MSVSLDSVVNNPNSKAKKLDVIIKSQQTLSDSESITNQRKNTTVLFKKLKKKHVINNESSELDNKTDKQDDLSTIQNTFPDNSAQQRRSMYSKQRSNETSTNKQYFSRQSSVLSNHHELYIELEELTFPDENNNSLSYTNSTSINEDTSNHEWKIQARWIKYEQTIDQETLIWSKPFAGALVYQNLIYLKNAFQYATLNLNTRMSTFDGIIDEIIIDFINRGHLNKDNKEKFRSIILSKHRNHLSVAGVLSGLDKKASYSEMYSHNRKQSKYHIGTNHFHHNHHHHHSSTDAFDNDRLFRKVSSFNQQIQSIDLSDSLIEEKSKLNTVKFNVGSNNIVLSDGSDNNINNNTHSHKHIRSTFNLLKQTIKHTKVDLSMLTEIEAFLIMVGVVDFLDRPSIKL